MYKLVSDIEGSRWSFLNGYYIFGNVVWLCDKDEAKKYTLVDNDGNIIEVNVDDYVVECGFDGM